MKYAILDAAGTLTEFIECDLAGGTPPANYVQVPDDCDLVPGRYRWGKSAGGHEAFYPIIEGAAENVKKEPDAIRAIFKGFRSLQRAGVVAFEAETVEWLAAYAKTIDAQG